MFFGIEKYKLKSRPTEKQTLFALHQPFPCSRCYISI